MTVTVRSNKVNGTVEDPRAGFRQLPNIRLDEAVVSRLALPVFLRAGVIAELFRLRAYRMRRATAARSRWRSGYAGWAASMVYRHIPRYPARVGAWAETAVSRFRSGR